MRVTVVLFVGGLLPEEGGKVDGGAKGDITMRFGTATPPTPFPGHPRLNPNLRRSPQ